MKKEDTLGKERSAAFRRPVSHQTTPQEPPNLGLCESDPIEPVKHGIISGWLMVPVKHSQVRLKKSHTLERRLWIGFGSPVHGCFHPSRGTVGESGRLMTKMKNELHGNLMDKSSQPKQELHLPTGTPAMAWVE